MKNIYLITGNKDKLREFNEILGFDLKSKKIDLIEIQSLNPEEIGEHKVREAYKVVKKPVLVEDTSLEFSAFGRLPGTFIKWFIDELGPEDLVKMLKPFRNKKATARCLITYFNGRKHKHFEGIVKGRIADKPIGEHGFGWDNIFIPDCKIKGKINPKTFAQMKSIEKNKLSPRRIAIEKLRRFLS